MTLFSASDQITLADLLPTHWLPADVGETPIAGLQLDHRRLKPGEVFIALPGAVHDGRQFIDQAIASGASAVIAEAGSAEDTLYWHQRVPVVPVEGLSRFVSAIAGRFYGNPSEHLRLVGVTGTNGKTTCTHLLAQLWSHLGCHPGVIGTLGHGPVPAGDYPPVLADTGLTTADPIVNQTILANLLDRHVNRVAMEVSSHALDQDRVAALTFRGALFTNLSRDHLDYHSDMDTYGRAKSLLFEFKTLEYAVINIDDDFGQQLVKTIDSSLPVLTYSTRNKNADIYAAFSPARPPLQITVHTPWGKGTLTTQLVGEYNLSNLLGVLAVACQEGAELESVLEAVPHLQPVPGRMQVVDPALKPLVVVDYAHTPDSLEKSLQALLPQVQQSDESGKLWCVFGCGGERDKGKRPLMAAVAERLADAVVVTSDNPRNEPADQILADIQAGFQDPNKVTLLEDRTEAIDWAIRHAGAADIVLIAGKGHETYQQVGENRLPFSDLAKARLALRRGSDAEQGA